MSRVPPAPKKLYERFLDNLTSSRDQVFGKGWLFTAQVANEGRLNFAGVLLQMGGESISVVTGRDWQARPANVLRGKGLFFVSNSGMPRRNRGRQESDPEKAIFPHLLPD